jgi:hypothetical protein
MNSPTSIWAGVGLVLAALLIVGSVQPGMFSIASMFRNLHHLDWSGFDCRWFWRQQAGDKAVRPNVGSAFNFRLEQEFLFLTCSHFYPDMSESVQANKLGKGTTHGFQVAHNRQGQATRTRA